VTIKPAKKNERGMPANGWRFDSTRIDIGELTKKRMR
jgi:hypothetical protein